VLLWQKHYPQVEANVVASIVVFFLFSTLSQKEIKIKRNEKSNYCLKAMQV